MTTDTTEQIMALAESLAITPGEKSLPMATEDADEVIRSQLTENTGAHFLDSGSAYGRHWEENQENPPWDEPAYTVHADRDHSGGYVTTNVYTHMARVLSRDRTAVALEIALYALGYSEEYQRDSWLTCMEAFADAVDGYVSVHDLEERFNLPPRVADEVAGFAAEGESSDRRPFTFNTYNSEYGSLSQCLQATALDGGPYAEYWMVQVHQGADVRGGYTAPRVYSSGYDTPMTHERSYYCEGCDWQEAESVVGYDHPDLYFFENEPDPFKLEEVGLIEEDEEVPVLEAVWDADHIDGAIIHDCQGTDRLGHVHP